MFRLFTFWFTALSAAICLFHAFGYDHDNIVLKLFSIPAWVIPIFADINRIHTVLMYALTILSWSALGFYIDWLTYKRRKAF